MKRLPTSNSWFCPHCGYRNSSSEFCTECRAANPLLPPVTAASTPSPTTPREYVCPHCQAEQTMTYEMAWQAQTSIGISPALALRPGTAGVAGAPSTAQTLLAHKLAPPQAPEGVNWIVFLLLGIGLGGLLWYLCEPFLLSQMGRNYDILALLGIFGGSLLITRILYDLERRGWRLRQAEYEETRAQWLQQMLCLRCGASWKREERQQHADPS